MKVFYQKQTWQPLKPGEAESASIENVEFPVGLFEELGHVLEESQKVLPPTARKFQGWEVGLLQRFDVGDLAASSNEQEHVRDNSNEESDGNMADVESEASDGEMGERGRERHRDENNSNHDPAVSYKPSVEDEA
jgi:hypothetical protein